MQDSTADEILPTPRASSLAEAFDLRACGMVNAHHFAEPQAAGAVPMVEAPTPCGWPLLDQTLGGLIPGAVTVLRTRWVEAAVALTASLTVSVARGGRHVLLATFGPDAGPIIDAAAASASRARLRDVCMLDLSHDGRTYMKVRSSLLDLPVMVASSVPDADAARAVVAGLAERPALVVVSDADAGGSVVGSDVLPGWRAAAAALGIPIVLVISGAGYEWTEPDDAHVEVTQTHFGRDFACFIARGVLPFGPASETLELQLWRAYGEVLVGSEGLHSSRVRIPRRRLERSWEERAKVPFEHLDLLRFVHDPFWAPADVNEAKDVLLSLATYAFEGDFEWSRLGELEPGPLERVVRVCGGLDVWARTLSDVGRDHDRRAWEDLETSALPRPELPDDPPREWRLTRERDPRLFRRGGHRTPIGGGLCAGPTTPPVEAIDPDTKGDENETARRLVSRWGPASSRL